MLPEQEKSAEKMELDREEAALRSEAESIDPARPEDATYHDDANPAAKRAAASENQDSSKTERTDSAKPSDAKGTDKPDTSKATADTNPKPDAKQQTPEKKSEQPIDESKLTPFQKERVRLDTSWKKVQQRQAELDKRAQEIEARAQQIEQQQKQATTKKPDGPSADDYEGLAKDFEAEGKMALAQSARQKAAQLREEAKTQPTGTRERFSQEEVATMQKQWAANLEQAGKDNPELLQEGTPLRARVAELLKSTPILHQSGDGILYAVAYAKAELRAKRADELQAKIAELEKEKQRLEGLTSLPSGSAQPRATARKFDELSLEDQEAALREEAAA